MPGTFRRYLRCGVTSVVDVGGPFWNFTVRDRASGNSLAPRVAVAGPLISSVTDEPLDLGDPPIVKVTTPDEGRAMVRKQAAEKPDLIKIWYILDQGVSAEAFRPIVRAVIDESHQLHLRVAVHATELETARAAVEEGAEILVHSIIDQDLLLAAGREEIRKRYEHLFAGTRPLHAEILQRISAGRTVIDQERLTGLPDAKTSEGFAIYDVTDRLIRNVTLIPADE